MERKGNKRLPMPHAGSARPSVTKATYTTTTAASSSNSSGSGPARGRGRGKSRGRDSYEAGTGPVVRGRVTPEAAWTGKVVRIISGGQTGADRAGLEAGRLLGVATGGTAPDNFLTEHGPDLSLKRLFGLNVDDADGTIAFRLHPGNGTDKTIGWAQLRQWTYGPERAQSKDDGWRPVLVIEDVGDERLEETAQQIRDWITRNKVAIVNIAGHRETTSGMGKAYGEQVTKILQHALAGMCEPHQLKWPTSKHQQGPK